MKITPIDIRHKEFKRTLRGYSEEEVDIFLDEVADDFELVFKENIELQDEVHRLKEQVAQYETLKETLQKTLVSAQQQADAMQINARKEAELVLRDAEIKARGIVGDAYSEKQKVQQSVLQLRQAEDDFRFKFKSLLEAHLNLLLEDEASDERRRLRSASAGEDGGRDGDAGHQPSTLTEDTAPHPGPSPAETVDAKEAVATVAAGVAVSAESDVSRSVGDARVAEDAVTEAAPSSSTAAPVEVATYAAAASPVAGSAPVDEPVPSSGPAQSAVPITEEPLVSSAQQLEPVEFEPAGADGVFTEKWENTPEPPAPSSMESGPAAQRPSASEPSVTSSPLPERGGAGATRDSGLGLRFSGADELDLGPDLDEPLGGGDTQRGGEERDPEQRGKRESSVRRFFFGSKGDGRAEGQSAQDRDFDW